LAIPTERLDSAADPVTPSVPDPASPTASEASSRTVAVRLEGVVKRFGDDDQGRRVAKFVDSDGTFPVVAVAGVDLDVYDGEFFSMLGPSGSGKTTTLRMIAGFELPTEEIGRASCRERV